MQAFKFLLSFYLSLTFITFSFSQSVSFEDAQIISPIVEDPSSLYLADLNNDGLLDIICAGGDYQTGHKVGWFQNMGMDTFSPLKVLASNGLFDAGSVVATDLDGDTDMDIIATIMDTIARKIVWFENTDGAGSFTPPITLSTTDSRDLFPIDIDGDADIDILSAEGNFGNSPQVVWYENLNGQGNFSSPHAITNMANGVTSVYASDFDGDTDPDVFSATSSGQVSWYENTNGQGSFGNQQVISNTGASDVKVIDLDGDNDNDVLVGGAKIGWFENNGQGGFGPKILIGNSGVNSMLASNVDADNDIDVLFINNKYLGLYENLGGNFSPIQKIDSSDYLWRGRDLAIGDFDGNGQKEIVVCNTEFDEIIIYSLDTLNSQFKRLKLLSGSSNGASKIICRDLDMDGDCDAISLNKADATISWYENRDGMGTFGPPKIIAVNDTGSSIYAADIDGDNDLDIISPKAWYKNTDSLGNYVLGGTLGSGLSIYAADIDSDGDQDIFSGGVNIGWYENMDGNGSFGTYQVFDFDPDDINSIIGGDIDGDLDIDIAISTLNGTVSWYKNTNGQGNLVKQSSLSPGYEAKSVKLSDIDTDGDLDIIYAIGPKGFDSRIIWHENQDSRGTFGPAQTIDIVISWDLDIKDLDRDGDPDIVTTNSETDRGSFPYISWYENIDGKGTFSSDHEVSSDLGGKGGISISDANRDGREDIFFARNFLAWYENVVASTFITPDLSTSNIFAYPNPSNGILHIKNASVARIASVSFYDVLGREIKIEKIPNDQHISIKVPEFHGIGFLVIRTFDGILTQKIKVR